MLAVTFTNDNYFDINLIAQQPKGGIEYSSIWQFALCHPVYMVTVIFCSEQ